MRANPAKFGELLVKAGLVNAFQLDSALSYQRNCGGRLGESLIKLGYISEDELLNCLAQQYQLVRVNLFKHEVDSTALDCLPAARARELNVLPVGRRVVGGHAELLVAMNDPTNPSLFETLRLASGCRIQAALAPAADIRDAITYYYGEREAAAAASPGADHTPQPAVAAPSPADTEARLQALLQLLFDKGVLTRKELDLFK